MKDRWSADLRRWTRWRSAAVVLALHALLGTTWILVGDHLAGTSWRSLQTAKGLGFVAVSNVLLAVLLWRHLVRLERIQARLDAGAARLLREREDAAARLREQVDERTAELREASRELERLTWCISHDLRAPVRTVRTRLELLAAELGALAPRAERHLEAMRSACERQEDLIGDLLGRLRLGRHADRQERIELEVPLTEALADLPGGRQLVSCPDDLPAVLGRPVLLRSLIWNLLSNAVRHGGASPERPVEVSARREGDVVELRVRDQGPPAGLPAAPARSAGGGLGLRSASACAERMGGSVLIEAGSPTDGTCVRVRLRAADPADAGRASGALGA